MNAIVVAGDKGKSHPVLGRNKALLDVHGLPVVARVVSALDRAESVLEIYVVGPKEKLERALSPEHFPGGMTKPLHFFEQHKTLYENVWYTFLQTIPSSEEPIESITNGPDPESVVLVVAADMPLLTAAEVDELVSNADMDHYDFVFGLTLEENLRPYYSTGSQPGIRMAYLHFQEGNFRQNNMSVVRPFRILNRHYVQTMYDLRYQKEFGNIVRLAWEVMHKEEGGWSALGHYLLLQLSLLLSQLRLGFLRDFVRRRTSADSVVSCVSKLMKTRFTYACTSLGGAALDIDNEVVYEVIKQRFSEWMLYQEEKAKELTGCASPD